MAADENTPATPTGTAETTTPPAVQDAGNVSRTLDPPEVTEAEGEAITESDPQALPKLRLREQRLAGERDAARQEAEELRAQLAEKEKTMADDQNPQATEQLTTVTRERDDARQEAAGLKLEKELSGKVVDTEAAVRLMGTDFRKEDGSMDVDAFLTKYPYLKPTAAATAPDGGGGTQTGTGKDAEIAALQQQLDAAQKAGNRVLAVSIQSKLTNLRQQQ